MTSHRKAQRPTDDQPVAALAELRQVTPPAALVARVMTSVAAPRPWTFRQAFARLLRAELRLSVRTALLLAAFAGVGAWAVRRPQQPAILAVTPPAAQVADSPAPVLVRFTFEDSRAHQVFVAGDFNDWNPIPLDHEDGARDSLFVATVALPKGVHEYMFLVDGTWVRDPLVSDSRPDGFGRKNSLLRL
jgi:hypothetical protein